MTDLAIILAQAAVQLHNRGMAVVPLHGKAPIPENWQKARLSPDELVRIIRSENGRCTGIGVISGKLSGDRVNLDFDGEEWSVAFETFLTAWDEARTAPQVATGSGKRHLWLVCRDMPESFTNKTFARKGVKAAINLRGNASNNVVPPSIHPKTGLAYEWATAEADWIEVSFEELYNWLAEWAGEPRWGQEEGRRSSAGPLPERIPEGQRDMALTSLAGSLRRRGASEGAILAALKVENETRCVPPLSDAQVEKIVRSVGKYEPAQQLAPGQNVNETDLGNARRLIGRHGADIRYCHAWGKWLLWRGSHWEKDETAEIERLARNTVASIYAEAAQIIDDDARKALAKWALKSESRSRLENMIRLAEAEIYVPHSELDANHALLNCLNGTVDLRTGRLKVHERNDMITKVCGTTYNPQQPCPTWEAFLQRIMAGNTTMIRFLQRAVGYSLTGLTTEQCLFFTYGTGANGKSTFIETIAAMLGDYAQKAPTEMLMLKHNTSIPNDVARLPGARFVVAAEIEEGRRLAESLVKDLTGGDTMVARFLHEEFFEFRPTHKLWIYGNHKPIVKGTDDGIWRRMRMIPFTVTIPKEEQDGTLPERLREELPGILAWAVKGCLEWQREGLGMPAEVQAATSAYRAEMDTITAFLDECCVLGDPLYRTRASELYRAYAEWCKRNGENAMSGTRFGNTMRERGFNKARSHGGYWSYLGIGLLDDKD